MAEQIRIEQMKAEIDSQKRAALSGTVHVLVEGAAASLVGTTAQNYADVSGTPDLFEIHQFKGGIPPAQILPHLANSVPHILAFCLFSRTNKAAEHYAHVTFPISVRDLPFVELKIVDITTARQEDLKFLGDVNIDGNPTVLVYKLGHLIDSFVPIAKFAGEGTEIIEERNSLLAEKEENPPQTIDIDHGGRIDPGREEFERKLAEKKRRETELEEQRKRLKKRRVLAELKSRKGGK